MLSDWFGIICALVCKYLGRYFSILFYVFLSALRTGAGHIKNKVYILSSKKDVRSILNVTDNKKYWKFRKRKGGWDGWSGRRANWKWILSRIKQIIHIFSKLCLWLLFQYLSVASFSFIIYDASSLLLFKNMIKSLFMELPKTYTFI